MNMNPFLVAFAGCLFALLVIAIAVYTYLSIKVRPFVRRMKEAGILPPDPDWSRVTTEDQAFDQGKLAGMRLEAIERALKRGERVVVLPAPSDLATDHEAATHRAWEQEIIDVLNGRVQHDDHKRCPMCHVRFEEPPAELADPA